MSTHLSGGQAGEAGDPRPHPASADTDPQTPVAAYLGRLVFDSSSAACWCFAPTLGGGPSGSASCLDCMERVRRHGYILAYCDRGHGMILPPGAPQPRLCPRHADGLV
jgi:hypothetical protein